MRLNTAARVDYLASEILADTQLSSARQLHRPAAAAPVRSRISCSTRALLVALRDVSLLLSNFCRIWSEADIKHRPTSTEKIIALGATLSCPRYDLRYVP